MMKVAVLLCVFLSQAIAGPSKPDVSIGISSDGFDKGALGVLEPHVAWETSGTFSGCDVSVCSFFWRVCIPVADGTRVFLTVHVYVVCLSAMMI